MATKHRIKRFNERVKLSATTVNALGIGIAASAIILPVVREGADIATYSTAIWILVAFALHFTAQAILGLLKDEDAD